jgi:hypothetical protein
MQETAAENNIKCDNAIYFFEKMHYSNNGVMWKCLEIIMKL